MKNELIQHICIHKLSVLLASHMFHRYKFRLVVLRVRVDPELSPESQIKFNLRLVVLSVRAACQPGPDPFNLSHQSN